MATPLLHIDQLTVRFGAAEVVRQVSLDIHPGEKLALVGESGSGKTVMAQAVLRLNREVNYQGRIELDGVGDVLSLSERALRGVRGRDAAMIFQEPMTALNPLYSVGNQICETLTLHLGLSPRQARAEALALLARTGIPDPASKIDSYPFQLSGGQRQRAMIAMALACRPRLLIADEPTTALDVTVQAQILDLLADVQREFGMAVWLITHDLNLVRRFADRVAVMRAGQIVESGPVAQVFTQPAHDYTRQLLASRPGRLVDAGDPKAAEVARAEQLSVSYRQRAGWLRSRDIPILRDVSLRLRAGHTLGIVGESGSGKTTLGLALLKLVNAQTRGRVVVAGQALDGLPARALRAFRRQAQVVFQDPFSSLSPRLTVGEIVGEGLALHEPQLSASERQARVAAMLAEVGLSADCLPRYPHEFSGGQRQRIAIARALVLRPQLLLLDEPTSALDASIQQQVLTLLRDAQQRYGVAYLFISHDLAVIRAMAHDVLVLRHGQVVESGPAEQLFAAPQAEYTRALLAAARVG